MRNLLKFASIILILMATSLQGCSGSNPSITPTQLPAASAAQTAAQATIRASPVLPAAQVTASSGAASTAALFTQGQYAVILIKEGAVLNVRQSPGTSSTVLETLPPHSAGFSLTGKTSVIDSGNWLEINRPGGGTGWVNASYLTEYHPSNTFCGDAQATALLEAFKNAVLNKNGEQLAGLVSPTHGVTVQYLRGGNSATYTPGKALWLFTSTYQMDWGANPASGQEVIANFHEEVLPKLEEVLSATYTPVCNNVQTGGASYTYQWPFEYGNINYYSLYHPATTGNDQAWRTWLVGIEYVSGKPYIFSLVHLYWEP